MRFKLEGIPFTIEEIDGNKEENNKHIGNITYDKSNSCSLRTENYTKNKKNGSKKRHERG